MMRTNGANGHAIPARPKSKSRKRTAHDDELRGILEVLEAVKRGDFTARVEVGGKVGTTQQIAREVNELIDRLQGVGSEIIRVAREVGTEGKLGAQAEVRGMSGTWKDLTDNVNGLAANLTNQVRNIALVTTAVANGDLSQKITVEAKGEILELKNTINRMVDQLRAFASEVTRVAREVGTEGKLGAVAEVQGVAGTWKDLTHNVNALAGNLTNQVRNIALVTTAVANGDLSQKITVDARGEILELKETINTMVDQLRAFAAEVTRVAREVGTDGKLGGQAQVSGIAGTWKDLTDNVNQLAGNLTAQVRNIALVTNAIQAGDLSQKITVEAKGEILELKNTMNRMVDQLRAFAAEVTRVAREVGTEGKLGGQAKVPDVAGTWKDLTENVNVMASNLTSQVRGIAKVVTAVAQGDLRQKLALEAKGEIASLADTINDMTNTLRVFAEQVTTVAREVGIEGQLGGQAKVPGASGTWRDLTDAVNQLASNLTTQVRAIAEVATAVTAGDLTRAISVEAQGELLQLKDNINTMIANLRDTTRANKEQDWLKTNLAKFGGMMQGQRSIASLARLVMSELTPLVSAQQGLLYVLENEDETPMLQLLSSYAFESRKQLSNRFSLGEGLVGQCALEKKTILVTDVPGDYLNVRSGLGKAPPSNIIVLPVLFEGQLKAVIELASFQQFTPIHVTFLDQLVQSIGVVFNMIGASMRTEELLQELQRSNSELGNRSRELEEKASELEIKNREIARASASLEEKARELARASKYKSDFLANMSHELRTPLNSLLILAKLLADNEEKTLTPQQVEYARTICSSGHDLLSLINEILDLSKVEAGKVEVKPQEMLVSDLREFVVRSFDKVAEQKALEFRINVRGDAPSSVHTDPLRLQQISEEPPLERVQVHEQRLGDARDLARAAHRAFSGRLAAARRRGHRVRGDGHRHRHPRRQAAHRLRGVPPSRRVDEPHVRRHRARARDQPRARALARGRDHAPERARQGQHVHALHPNALRGGELSVIAASRARHARLEREADGAGPARAQGARGRRRRPKCVRDPQLARAPRDARPPRGRRARVARRAPEASRRRPRPDGHHDARGRRLRRDPQHSGDRRVSHVAHHRAHVEGDGRRSRESARGRLHGLRTQAGRQRPAPCGHVALAYAAGAELARDREAAIGGGRSWNYLTTSNPCWIEKAIRFGSSARTPPCTTRSGGCPRRT